VSPYHACACLGGSAKASTAATALRARVAELARKADLAQTLLGNLVPVSMRDLASTPRVRRLVSMHACMLDRTEQ
jgi:hypothetical protein